MPCPLARLQELTAPALGALLAYDFFFVGLAWQKVEALDHEKRGGYFSLAASPPARSKRDNIFVQTRPGKNRPR